MITNTNYIRNSLELHLFFARTMKEHSFFLEISFLDKNKDYQKIANDFQDVFNNVLNNVIQIADKNISEEFILSNEMVTDNTLIAEKKSTNLTGVNINNETTTAQLNLKSGLVNESNDLINKVNDINKKTLILIENLIYFKNTVLNEVLECKLFTTNYPLLIKHLINEAKMYHTLLTKLQNREEILNNNYMLEQELFWNDIMKEHAQFIRGLLDPTENDLIITANNFAKEYGEILQKQNHNLIELTATSLNETINFKQFKSAGEKGILNCEIKSVIIPILTDHVLREANHFIRLLKNVNNNQ